MVVSLKVMEICLQKAESLKLMNHVEVVIETKVPFYKAFNSITYCVIPILVYVQSLLACSRFLFSYVKCDVPAHITSAQMSVAFSTTLCF